MREIFQAIQEARREGKSCVFCSVVQTRGSTPQKPGAVMLLFADGSQVGTLGGGCTEAEVRQSALKLMDHSQPKLMTFVLDDDYGWDDGLICGGRMTFCAQPMPVGNDFPYFQTFGELLQRGQGCTEAIVVDPEKSGLPAGARFLFDRSGEMVASLWAEHCPDSVRSGLQDLADRPKPRTQGGIAYSSVLPRCRLLIVGGGHIGQAVASLAHEVDFDVWVLDDRERFACRERFPHAQKILVGDVGRTLKDFVADQNTYALIVTRGHNHDEEALYHLAEKPAGYVGMIGSKRKIHMIFEDLEKEGISPEALARVYAPLGMDIGSKTVPEIALSILAQLVGHRNRGPEAFPPPRKKDDKVTR